jgi:hypothetical protein
MLVLSACVSAVVAIPASASASTSLLFAPGIPNVKGVVTNEYAYWNATLPNAVRSTDWAMTSGTLFSTVGADGGVGSSGIPDDRAPDARSLRGTNSAVFRLNTKRSNFGDVNVRFKLNIEALSSTRTTPAVAWDGVHIWLRYQGEESLYYASVARRDGHVLIKKKCSGGPSNGGTYYTISPEVSGYPISYNTWSYVSASVHNNPNGSVTIKLYENDRLITSATDSGIGCAAITQPGAVGIRGDNARFRFHTFQVRAS